jgi:hypothetical protein
MCFFWVSKGEMITKELPDCSPIDIRIRYSRGKQSKSADRRIYHSLATNNKKSNDHRMDTARDMHPDSSKEHKEVSSSSSPSLLPTSTGGVVVSGPPIAIPTSVSKVVTSAWQQKRSIPLSSLLASSATSPAKSSSSIDTKGEASKKQQPKPLSSSSAISTKQSSRAAAATVATKDKVQPPSKVIDKQAKSKTKAKTKKEYDGIGINQAFVFFHVPFPSFFSSSLHV